MHTGRRLTQTPYNDPSGFAFYVAYPIRSIETRSLATSLGATHRGVVFYVAFSKTSIPSDRDVFCLADPIGSAADCRN